MQRAVFFYLFMISQTLDKVSHLKGNNKTIFLFYLQFLYFFLQLLNTLLKSLSS